jgi:hypothetical protein
MMVLGWDRGISEQCISLAAILMLYQIDIICHTTINLSGCFVGWLLCIWFLERYCCRYSSDCEFNFCMFYGFFKYLSIISLQIYLLSDIVLDSEKLFTIICVVSWVFFCTFLFAFALPFTTLVEGLFRPIHSVCL